MGLIQPTQASLPVKGKYAVGDEVTKADATASVLARFFDGRREAILRDVQIRITESFATNACQFDLGDESTADKFVKAFSIPVDAVAGEVYSHQNGDFLLEEQTILANTILLAKHTISAGAGMFVVVLIVEVCAQPDGEDAIEFPFAE